MTSADHALPTAADLNARADAVTVEARETAFQGFFRLDRYVVRHALFAGGTGAPITRELLERGHAVAVLPYDPDRDVVVLVEQFRIGAFACGLGPWLREVVAGVIDPGETPEAVARRETKEEAGCTLRALERIQSWLSSAGCTSETITLFVGHVDADEVSGVHGLADEGEDIRPVVVPVAELFEAMRAGALDNAQLVIAAQWLALNREDLRARWCGSVPS